MARCQNRSCWCGWMVFCFGAGITGCRRPPGPPPNRSGPVAATSEIKTDANVAGKPAPAIRLSPADWPMWRGPNEDGVSTAGTAPTMWAETENIVWKAAIPGRGHSSPIIVGDRIYFETADDQQQVQSVICLNRADGLVVWQTEIHHGNFEKALHAENTQASSTLACDGERLFALFLNDRKIKATAIDLGGKIVWQVDVENLHRSSAIPHLQRSLKTSASLPLITAAGASSPPCIAKPARLCGKKPRDRGDSYASPRVITLAGKSQVILGGTRKVVSYAPLTGTENWSAQGTAEADVGTAVTAGDLVFVSGGYPEAEIMAVGPDGKVVWRKNVKSYVPSLIAHDGHVYFANDEGIIICWEAASGNEKWKKRIGGNFRVSPLLVGGNTYVTDMSAKTTVFKATPEAYEAVAENRLGTEAFASPAVSHGQLFLRVADTNDGVRSESLYCIGITAESVALR